MPPNKAEAAVPPSSDLTGDRIQVDDKIYDAVKLASFHPGGPLFVKAFAGLDASEAFLSYHRKSFPHSKLSEYQIATVPSRKNPNSDAEYLELCGLVEKILPRHASFATWAYLFKVFSLLALAVGLEVYIHYTSSYRWYLCAPLGFLFALIGMNIQHDANHGAISRNFRINRLLGLSQNWLGGSAIDWIHQHVVQHHVNTNDIYNDPDIVGNILLRLNPLRPMLKYHAFQHLYVFILLTFFGFTVIEYSTEFVYRGFHHIRMSPLIRPQRMFDLFTSFIFVLRWGLLPFLNAPSIWTYMNIAPMFVIGGYYLAFFFLISHNFKGVYLYDRSERDPEESFLRGQVKTSSNVGGPWLCFLNGGLNYQIEHHLFPRIQHSHYPLIAPVVKEFCEKRGIPYVHFPTVSENFKSCVEHLHEMGSKTTPDTLIKTKAKTQ